MPYFPDSIAHVVEHLARSAMDESPIWSKILTNVVNVGDLISENVHTLAGDKWLQTITRLVADISRELQKPMPWQNVDE